MARQPNVVIFFTDQQRWDCSSLHGNPLELMPNFDRLAHHGTHLFNSFTCAPVCGPARACLQTGAYITSNGVVYNSLGLPANTPTLAQCFNDAGYHTGYIGKWHLAGAGNCITTNGGGGAVPAQFRGGWREWLAVEALEFSVHEYHTVLYNEQNQPVRLPGYRTDAVTDAGIRFIDRNRRQPFCLMMSLIEPHHQNDKDDYPPPDGYRERYTGRWTPPDLAALPHWSAPGSTEEARRNLVTGGTSQQHLGGYFGMVKRLDEAFGRVIDALRSLDLLDNTIVLFTSDHACHFKTRNAEYKRSCHDSSIRVPTLLHGGPFTGGRTLHQPVSLVDLPATLLDACGIPVPATMQGRSILPLLRGDDADWPEEVLVQICDDKVGRCVRTRRWKYCVMSDQTSYHVKNNFADVTYHEAFLYDMHHDPYELCNLIHEQSHDAVKQRMRQRLIQRMTAIGESVPRIELAPTHASGQRAVHAHEIEL